MTVVITILVSRDIFVNSVNFTFTVSAVIIMRALYICGTTTITLLGYNYCSFTLLLGYTV